MKLNLSGRELLAAQLREFRDRKAELVVLEGRILWLAEQLGAPKCDLDELTKQVQSIDEATSTTPPASPASAPASRKRGRLTDRLGLGDPPKPAKMPTEVGPAIVFVLRREGRALSAAELGAATEASRSRITRSLSRLRRQGHVIAVGGKRRTRRYQLGTSSVTEAGEARDE